MNDINLGDATLPEAIAYFEVKLAKLTKEKLLLRIQNAKLKNVLDELCAHAEPVCDTLEMGQSLKSPDTLKNFREHLSRGWEAL
jgi:hypothetical protein